MKLLRSNTLRVPALILGLGWLVSTAAAIDAESTAGSARELANRLSALRNGTSYTRLRLEVKQPGDTTKMALQLQIKERRTKNVADIVYQVLWPKERKGEAVLLHKAGGGAATGSLFMPPDKLVTLNASQMSESALKLRWLSSDPVRDGTGFRRSFVSLMSPRTSTNGFHLRVCAPRHRRDAEQKRWPPQIFPASLALTRWATSKI